MFLPHTWCVERPKSLIQSLKRDLEHLSGVSDDQITPAIVAGTSHY